MNSMEEVWKSHIATLTDEADALRRAISLARDEGDPLHTQELEKKLSGVESSLLGIARRDRERRAGLPVQALGGAI